MSVNCSLSSVAMYALSHDTSGCFLLHSNTLEMLKYFVTSHATSFFASFCFLFAHSDSSFFLEHNSFMSAETFWAKGLLMILRFGFFSFVEQLCHKVLLSMLCFDLFSFVTLTFEHGGVISTYSNVVGIF